MAPLAQAFVRLRPQLSEAEVRAQAVRAGETAGLAMGHSMSSGVSRTFKAFAGLGAATGLVEAGRKVMEFADQFEGARARVETNTQNIGASFAAVQKPLGDLDTKLSAFGFTITDTENSFAQLVTATKSPAKAMRDVALAADIARGRHISLDEATQILMRVETGHVAMLGRMGIATHDASGHIFTQAQALDALGQAYGGNASKFAETFAGKQAAARAEMQQSATEIGVALLPAFADLANVLAHDVLPPIAEAARWFDRNRKTIEPLVKVVLIAGLGWKAYSVGAKLAVEATKLLGVSATSTAGKVAAASAIEAAATRRTAAMVIPDLRAMTLANDAAALAGRRRLLALGAGALGAGAAVAGSAVPGTAGRALSNIGTGAAIGAVAGPEGAAVGAAIGGVATLLNSGGGVNPRYRLGVFNNPIAPQAKVDTAATNALKAATAALATTENTLGLSLQRTSAQMATHVQHALALRSAQDGLRSAMHAAAQTAVDSGRALVGNSDAALANRDAVRAEVTQIFAVIDAMKQRGATDQAQSNMLDILTQAVEQNAIKTYGDKAAVDALLASLGLIPGRALAAANALAAINNAVAADKAISPAQVKAATASSQAASAAGKKIAASFTSGYTPVVSKSAAAAGKAVSHSLSKAAQAAAAAMTKARNKMTSDLQSIKDSINSTQQSLAGFADIASNAGNGATDVFGVALPPPTTSAFLLDRATKLEQFASLFRKLDSAGLDPRLLAQFAQVGPAAIPAMRQLLGTGRGGIRQVNALETRVAAASRQVGIEEASFQNSTLIHRDLQTLPRNLARELATELRALHIVVKADNRVLASSVKAGATKNKRR